MNKQLTFLFLMVFLLGLVNAGEQGENIGTYPKDTCVKLPQTCASCSYSKISSIVSPNQTTYAEEVSMTKNGTFYYYDFCNTTELGEYKVNGHFDIDGTDQVFNYVFSINASGNGSNLNSIAIIVSVIAVMALFGYFGMKLLDSSVSYFGYILLGVSAMLGITALYYGSLLAKDLFTDNFFNIQINVYTAVFLVAGSILIISGIITLVKYLKDLSRMAEMKKNGEGYNPDTKQYDY
jgi:amino acid transporter